MKRLAYFAPALLATCTLMSAVICTATNGEQLQARLWLFEFTNRRVRGMFSVTLKTDAGLRNTPQHLNFDLNDDTESTTFTLRQRNGDNLLHFKWTHDTNGEMNLSEHAILNSTCNVTDPPQMSSKEAQNEASLFARLRETAEYRALPLLSNALGSRNVTGSKMNSAHALHRFAADAEELHGTFANSQEGSLRMVKDRQRARHRHKRSLYGNVIGTRSHHRAHSGHHRRSHSYQSRHGYYPQWPIHQQERSLKSLLPFSKENTFACNSLSGRCSNELLNYKTPGTCTHNGWPITPNHYPGGCMGMCGPGCYHCWKHICGDCCGHPNCLKHDQECAQHGMKSLFECATGKGVLWGGKNSGWRLRRGC